MRKITIFLLLLLFIFVTSCSNEAKNIYIGDDGYLYINNEKTEVYSTGKDAKSAYEVALENGYGGTFNDWLRNITKDNEEIKISNNNNDSAIGKIQIINNQVFLVCNYTKEVEIRMGTLLEPAYEGYSMYDLFVTNNVALNTMNSMRTIIEEYTDYSGSTQLVSTFSSSKPYSMYVEGTVSQQAISKYTYSGNYYIACKVYCTRYEHGYLGVFAGSVDKYPETSIQRTNEDFETVSSFVALNNNNIFIGSINQANLDGYVDDTVAINLNMFNTIPTIDKLNELYERFIKISNREVETSTRYEYVTEKRMYLLGNLSDNHTDREAKTRFMTYMNEKAKQIGMENTTFVDAAGFYNKTTAVDLLRLAIYACSYDKIVEIWHKNNYTITVSGNREREVNLTTSVASPLLEDYYYLYGGKTGTVDGQSNLLCVLLGPDNKLFVVCVLGATSDRFQAAKEAMDAAVAKYYDPKIDSSSFTVSAQAAAVCLLPPGNTKAYTDYPLDLLYAKDETSIRTPASITKVMTAICALDYIQDVHQELEIKSMDITAGSGNYFYAGDRISFYEALHAMFLPSSNTCAEAVATTIGHLILAAE